MIEEELKPTRKRRGDVPPAAETREALGDSYVSPLRAEPKAETDPDPQLVIDEAEHLEAFATVFGEDLTPLSRAKLSEVLTTYKPPRGLHAKLAEMLGELKGVAKTGEAPKAMGGFKFTEAAVLAEKVRDLLAAKGISMLPERQEIAESSTFQSASMKTQFLVTVKTTWRLTDAESGETATFESLGSGQDNSDKAFPKAMTNSMKYAMLMGWLVPQGDDPERFENEPPAEIKIEGSNVPGVQQGGRQTKATEVQIKAIRTKAREKGLEPADMLHIMEQVMGQPLDDAPDVPEELIPWLVETMEEMTFEQAANVVSMLTAVE